MALPRVLVWHLAVGGVASVALYTLNMYLLQLGGLSEISVNMAAKVMLAYDGAPPRLENISVVYPAAPFFLSLLLRDHILATSVLGGFAMSGAIWYLKSLRDSQCLNAVLGFACLAYLIFLPQTLYVFSQRIDISLTLAVLSISLLALRKVELYRGTFYMTVAGLCMALLFLSDYAATLGCLLFAPLVAWESRRAGDSAAATLLMTYLPLVFFVLVQYPMSILFTGALHPFTEWHNLLHFTYETGNQELFLKGNLVASLQFMAAQLVDKALIIAPWPAVGALTVLRPGKGRFTGLILYFPIPLVYMVSSLYLGFPFFIRDTAHYLVFPVVALLLLHPDFGRDKTKGFFATMLLVVSLVLSLAGGYRLAATTRNPMERSFYSVIWTQEQEKEWSALMELSQLLKGPDASGRILMDSKRNLDLVFTTGEPKRFLLPYQLDFEIGLSLPAAYVEYVVVYSDPAWDLVARRYPQSMRGELPGFEFMARAGPRLLFKRASSTFQTN